MSVASLEVRLTFSPDEDDAVGRLAMIGRDVAFQYDPGFLARGLALSPFRLPLRTDAQVYDGTGGMTVFGLFDDALPDNWGRRLMEKHFQSALGSVPTVLDRLAYTGMRGRGALTFHPPTHGTELPNMSLDLAGLAHEAWDFDATLLEDAIPELRQAAGTSGGARPKVLVGLPDDEGAPARVLPGDGDLPEGWGHWIVKFDSRSDGSDAGPLEYAYMQMALSAGVSVPEHRLLETAEGRFFAARRFDRPASRRRLHLHSAAGLLQADYRIAGEEYATLFRLTEALTHDHEQKRELFLRACLNVLACNRDDHLKNFAFLMDRKGEWRLSPLFDFTFHPGPHGWQTLSVAGVGNMPGRGDLERLGAAIELRPRETRELLDRAGGAVAAFGRIASDVGVSAAGIRRVTTSLSTG